MVFVINTGVATANPGDCVTVPSEASIVCPLKQRYVPSRVVWFALTMNGSPAPSTYRRMPSAMRRCVASTNGLLRTKIDRAGAVQSTHSAAVRYGLSFPERTAGESLGPCVGSGQTTGRPSRRATTKSRFRVVGAP